MKTAEEALTEWIDDEVMLDLANGKRAYTRHQVESLCLFLKSERGGRAVGGLRYLIDGTGTSMMEGVYLHQEAADKIMAEARVDLDVRALLEPSLMVRFNAIEELESMVVSIRESKKQATK